MKSKFIIAMPLLLAGVVVGYFTLPWIILFFGIQFEANPPEPKNKYGEFPFHLVYEINGIQHTIDDTIICKYAGIGIDEGSGKHIKWEERLANGNKLTSFLFTEENQYGIELLDAVIEGNSTSIILDIGNPQYYLGYKKYRDYSPGRVSISSPLATGVISEDELWNRYNIKIIEKKFSQPLLGNDLRNHLLIWILTLLNCQ
ncbi:hypothetical protein J5Y03_11415 [Bacillus sp. RG28]|uniref:Uncharacterized protein n=1 Tax=Gottfriedia endophytica TaxID=2820819 RepID=A0A940NNC0_9BACI|nr:hypothetical protein [Gottfriedia endophytica]MBP0725781.1 hypothetical protein [Gottfriedia endophytica]